MTPRRPVIRDEAKVISIFDWKRAGALVDKALSLPTVE
jgi:hypothetical protein